MKMTLDAFDERFPDEEACKTFLKDQRWPDGVNCPKCGSPKLSVLHSRPFHWLCKFCGNYRFSVISGTIFENTKKPLKLWFRVAYFMLVSKKGMSALQIHLDHLRRGFHERLPYHMVYVSAPSGRDAKSGMDAAYGRGRS